MNGINFENNNTSEMFSAFWSRLTGLFGCIRPSDGLETTRKRSENEVYFAEALKIPYSEKPSIEKHGGRFRIIDISSSDYMDKVDRVLPNKYKKCKKISERMKKFSISLEKINEDETLEELMSSYEQILEKIRQSSCIISCSVAMMNAKALSDKCLKLNATNIENKCFLQLDSITSRLMISIIEKLPLNENTNFSFWPLDSVCMKDKDHLSIIRAIIKLLQRELLSISHLIQYLANKKKGRGQRLSLDLHGCNPAHAWHLASSAMDKMAAGEELELITGNGIDSKNRKGPIYRAPIREDFLEKFELYNQKWGMNFQNLGHPPKKATRPEELNEGVIVVRKVFPFEPMHLHGIPRRNSQCYNSVTLIT